MPITLEKLLSPTAETSFEWGDDTIHVIFAPLRYTGEMQRFAERISEEETAEQAAIAALRSQADEVLAAVGDEEDKVVAAMKAIELNAEADDRLRLLDLRDRKALRDSLASDGDGDGGPPGLLVSWDVFDGRKPLKTDRRAIDRLPDVFLREVFLSLARENQPDPQKAPESERP